MAGYDSYRPGRTDPLPGIPDFMGHDSAMSAVGSVATELPETSGPLSDRIQQGTVGFEAVTYGAYDSLATAQVVTVGRLDTEVPAEADLYTGQDANPLSGLTGDAVGYAGYAASVQGHTMARHPNSGR